jgi:FkbM family methyltransferase
MRKRRGCEAMGGEASMKMRLLASRIINGMINPFNLEIRRIRPQIAPNIGGPSCDDRLKHMKLLGFSPRIVFDVGAFIGKWAVSVAAIFPDARLVLIEPNMDIIDEIEKNIESIRDRVVIRSVAVSDKTGKGKLNVWDNSKHNNRLTALAASSLLPHVQGLPTKQINVDLTTLDSIAEEIQMYPDVLKLDLQGGEKKALLGAQSLLRLVELCIVEFGCLDAYINRTTSRDLMEIMYDNGFCLYDIVDMRYRPYDGALAGGDFFFLKADSQLREHKDYF